MLKITRNRERGKKEIRIPTQEDGIWIARPNNIRTCPTIHCQEIRLIHEKKRNLLGAMGRAFILVTIERLVVFSIKITVDALKK
jgi:hypothetical protein